MLKRTMGLMDLGRWIAVLMLVVAATPLMGQNMAVPPAPVAPGAAGAPAAAAANDPVQRMTVYFPTGQRATSVILLEKFAPNPVWVDKAFEYQLRVTNISSGVLNDVQLTERLSEGYKLNGTSPQAKSEGTRLRWELGAMKPGDSQVVRIHGSATKLGQIQNCASVSYDLGACMPINVIQPTLKLVKTAPPAVLMCDPIDIELAVSNSGSGDASNVVITDTLPEGMTTVDGQKTFVINVGSLPAGETRKYVAKVKAAKPGSYENKAVAKADGDLTSEAAATTVVQAPMLTITKTAPAKRFAGRPIDYEITVTNKGDGLAKMTKLIDPLPAGTQFASASAGGQFANNVITWSLGDIKPGESRKVEAVVIATQLGTVENVAQASAYCAQDVAAKAVTAIEGIPAILLEVIDESDPIEVGSEVIYMIRVTNQGSLAGTGIKIVVNLEDSMQYISASGSTDPTVGETGRTISFAPVASLAPKAQAVWRMRVKALKAGDVRFGVEMNSDQISRPVHETESTNFYQ